MMMMKAIHHIELHSLTFSWFITVYHRGYQHVFLLFFFVLSLFVVLVLLNIVCYRYVGCAGRVPMVMVAFLVACFCI